MTKPLTVLSLGWGVQSWTLAAMMALDEMPRADFLVHADTHHEHQETIAFRDKQGPWLGEHGLTVVTVASDRTHVNAQWSGSESVMIPAFTTDRLTQQHGQIRRQCTHDWKIMPIRRFIRQELTRRGRSAKPGAVESWQGISLDEWTRMRTSDVKYITNVYPLVDRRMTREGCVAWLERHNLPVPPKSACTFCPFKSIESWRRMKQADGPDWQEALEVDATIRDKRPKAALFVHPYRLPLAEAVRIPEDQGASQLGFDQLCDGGHCGV